MPDRRPYMCSKLIHPVLNLQRILKAFKTIPMDKFLRKIRKESETLLQIGIILIITGLGFKVLNTPGAEIYVTIGSMVTLLFSVITFLELFYSTKISSLSKFAWYIGLVFFNTATVLVYFFKRLNFGYNTSSEKEKSQLV